MRKQLTIFRIIYLLFLVFVLIHFILGLFGLAFTPGLWNIWFFGLSLTLFIHPWTIFYKTRIFQWYHLIFQIFSGLVTFYLWFAEFFVLSVISDPAVPINIDYRIEDKEIIIARGFLARTTYDHHELINPFIMKSEVKYRDE